MMLKQRITLWLGTGVAALTLGAFALIHPAGAQSPMPGAGSFPGGSRPGTGSFPGRPTPGGQRPGQHGRDKGRAGATFTHAVQDLERVAGHLREAPGSYDGHRDRAIQLIIQAREELRQAQVVSEGR